MAKLTVPELDPELPRVGYWRAFKAAVGGPLGEANPYAQARFTWCTDTLQLDAKVTQEGFCHHLYPSEVRGFEEGKRWLHVKLIVDCVKHELVYVAPLPGCIGYYKCSHCPLTASEHEARNHS